MLPIEAAVIPLPREETTPPVTKTYFDIGDLPAGFCNGTSKLLMAKHRLLNSRRDPPPAPHRTLGAGGRGRRGGGGIHRRLAEQGLLVEPPGARLLRLLRDREARAGKGPVTRLRPRAAKTVPGPGHRAVARTVHPAPAPAAAVLHARAGTAGPLAVPGRLRALGPAGDRTCRRRRDRPAAGCRARRPSRLAARSAGGCLSARFRSRRPGAVRRFRGAGPGP